MENQWQEIVRGKRAAVEEYILRQANLYRAGERQAIVESAQAKMEGASGTVRTALLLLADADSAWTTVSGLVRTEDKTVVGLVEAEGRFMAAQPPLRLRFEFLRESETTEESSRPDLVTLTDRQYWIVRSGHVENFRAPPEQVINMTAGGGEIWSVYEDGVERGRGGNVTYGTENLPALLRPSQLIRAFEFTSATQTIYAGREAIRLSAVPVASDDFFFCAPNLVVLGATEYDLRIDATCGILLAWTAMMDGKEVRGQVLTDVTIDAIIDERAFAPPLP